MSKGTTIYVYADWDGLPEPMLMGALYSELIRNKELFYFTFDDSWLKSKLFRPLDPDIGNFDGPQYPADGKLNFGAFLDSTPDRWGRLLMKRRETLLAAEEDRKPKPLNETDYLLGVFDGTRMGALRYKLSLDGPFLDDNEDMATPPWTSIRDLEYASNKLEEDLSVDDPNYKKWLYMLLEPGSSLGGARPKANVIDPNGHLWIAKFPSRDDKFDVGGWEKVANDMAADCGITLPETKIQRYSSSYHTFMSKRFDRTPERGRIHFASAMTLLGKIDGAKAADGASYLDIAEFITRQGANVEQNLQELWQRIVFSIAVSNTDDHLRNHGFISTEEGWVLSPAFDINPNPDGQGLKLNISDEDNSLSFDLALEVAQYFRVNDTVGEQIVETTKKVVSRWRDYASNHGISRAEQELMSSAFNYE